MYDILVDRPLKIFFSGIAGSGVSAIAAFMAERGNIVAGSDRAFDANPGHPLKKLFSSKGITIVPQDGSGLDRSVNFAVFSTAVESDRPEVVRAKELGIACKIRPEYLCEITRFFKTIAVAGTSGKSTAAGMLAFLMKELGLSPNFIGGGRVKSLEEDGLSCNALSGSSDYLVIEACESDGSIVNYNPEIAVLLNLALDHHSVEKTTVMFEMLIENTHKTVIINADDCNLAGLIKHDFLTFSIDSPSVYRATDVVLKPLASEFRVNGTKFLLNIPGKFNILNAMPCITLLSEMGIEPKAIARLLPGFEGIERRFDVYLNDGKGFVMDDYAHNPHKIAALMQTTKALKDSLCYIFQPHGFGPTRMMKNEYIDVFAENLRASDHLIILPIFFAGGTVSKDISSHDLVKEITARGKSAVVIEDREEIIMRSDEWNSYVIFGARDDSLSEFAEKLSERLKQ